MRLCQRVSAMQQLNVYRFYELGSKLHELFSASAQGRVADMFVPLTEAQALLDEKKAKLEAQTALLATPLGTEIALRDKYRIVKPDEGMVIITAPIQAPNTKPKSRMVRFWDMIVGIFR